MDRPARQMVLGAAALVVGVLLLTCLPLPNPPSLILGVLQLLSLPAVLLGLWLLVVRGS
jgi:hypothetical protein